MFTIELQVMMIPMQRFGRFTNEKEAHKVLRKKGWVNGARTWISGGVYTHRLNEGRMLIVSCLAIENIRSLPGNRSRKHKRKGTPLIVALAQKAHDRNVFRRLARGH